MNIVLAGMPASGKTTVSKQLERLGKKVYDTDAEIVKEHGEIKRIFEKHGEEYFRNLETITLGRLCELDGIVIATGGGCLMRKANTALLKQNGKIVYLRTDVETLLKRIEGDDTRPLLMGDARGKLQKLYDERTPVYERAADLIIDTDGQKPEEIAHKITELIK